MKLIDILSIIKGFEEVEITRQHMKKNEDGKMEIIEDTIYNGRLSDWDVKLTDVVGEYVEYVFCGYSDHVSIRLK